MDVVRIMWMSYTSMHLERELAWAVDKRLQIINNTMLFKTVMHPK